MTAISASFTFKKLIYDPSIKSLTIIQYKINRTYKKLRRSPMDRLQGLEPCPANMQDSRPFRINTVKLNHKDSNMHILPDYMQI